MFVSLPIYIVFFIPTTGTVIHDVDFNCNIFIIIIYNVWLLIVVYVKLCKCRCRSVCWNDRPSKIM